MTPAQCRNARALLNWTRMDLGTRSNFGDHVVRQFEERGHIPGAASESCADRLARMRRTLEAAGVEFIEQNDDGPGVRMRREAGS